MSEKEITLNGKKISESELIQIQEDAKKKKGVTITEISEGNFVQRLRD